jgi:hypothetical protein
MSRSSNATPETFNSSNDISAGESTVHQPPAATANKKYPHHSVNSPK